MISHETLSWSAKFGIRLLLVATFPHKSPPDIDRFDFCHLPIFFNPASILDLAEVYEIKLTEKTSWIRNAIAKFLARTAVFLAQRILPQIFCVFCCLCLFNISLVGICISWETVSKFSVPWFIVFAPYDSLSILQKLNGIYSWHSGKFTNQGTFRGVIGPLRSAAYLWQPTSCAKMTERHWREIPVELKYPVWKFLNVYGLTGHATWRTHR